VVKHSRSAPTNPVWMSAAARRLRALAGNVPVERAVQIVAGRLLDGVACPPTDLVALSARVGVGELREEDLPIAGTLLHDGSQLVIVSATHLSHARRRFTIAHEIGHALFEATGANPPRAGRELERLCDMLATEFLLPRDVFIAHAGAMPSLHHVFALAKLFDASLSATAIRCCEVGQVSAFEIEGSTLRWARGIARSVTAALAPAVHKALCGERVDDKVLLSDRGVPREWRLEGAPIASPARKRALFLLRPYA